MPRRVWPAERPISTGPAEAIKCPGRVARWAGTQVEWDGVGRSACDDSARLSGLPSPSRAFDQLLLEHGDSGFGGLQLAAQQCGRVHGGAGVSRERL